MVGLNEVLIVLLYLLSIQQQIQASDTTTVEDDCRSWRDIQTMQPTQVDPGSSTELLVANPNTCGDDSAFYTLQYQNQNSRKLESLYNETYYRVKTPPIYLNNSGIYCVREQSGCETEQCCIKVTVTKMEIQFTESAQLNTLEYGSCFVSAWPRPSKNSVVVDTNSGSCKIVILSIRFNDEYTTIVFFAIHVNSSCNHIICSGPSGVKKRAVNISPFTEPTPLTSPNNISPNMSSLNMLTSSPNISCANTSDNIDHSGAIGLHRIILWIIVLTLALLSMIITQC